MRRTFRLFYFPAADKRRLAFSAGGRGGRFSIIVPVRPAMLRFPSCAFKLCCLCFSLAGLLAFHATAQSQEALSQFFEGKQITVKMDMPGTQKGVDVYPDRPQPLDAKKYAERLKTFGTSLRNGDTVMVTKVKLKNDNSVEFQLGGGGYGTAGDVTDGAVRFTPADKSSREKQLEQQLNNETDPERRRALSRQLDDLRRDRERRDRRNYSAAQADAEARRDHIDAGRQQGGSRFNIHFDKAKASETVTPQVIMAVLGRYVDFPAGTFGSSGGGPEQAATQATPQTAVPQGRRRFKKGVDSRASGGVVRAAFGAT